MDVERSWEVIAEERRALADLLAGLDAAAWEEPSLCAGWRVRDVVGHITPMHPSPGRMLVEAVRRRGDFHRLNREMAIAHAARPPAQLVAELREHAASRRKPIVTTVPNLLFDVITHVQDVAIPLGLEHRPPADGVRAGAERVWAMGWPFHARRRLAGLRLVATDDDWTAGEGAEVRGGLLDLLLLLTDRTAAVAPRLLGPGTAQLQPRSSTPPGTGAAGS